MINFKCRWILCLSWNSICPFFVLRIAANYYQVIKNPCNLERFVIYSFCIYLIGKRYTIMNQTKITSYFLLFALTLVFFEGFHHTCDENHSLLCYCESSDNEAGDFCLACWWSQNCNTDFVFPSNASIVLPLYFSYILLPSNLISKQVIDVKCIRGPPNNQI